jgi:glucose/mannose-6-phosphate isomerase
MVSSNNARIQITAKIMDQFKKELLGFNGQLSFKAIKFFNLKKIKKADINAVIIVGMGGSGQIGDIIAGLGKELNIPVPIIVWKNSGLPNTNYTNPFFIFISFSGNTEETLSGFKEAKNKAVVCSGGKLLKIAKKDNTPIAYFKNPGIKPRQGSGLMFYGTIGILKNIFPKINIKTIKIRGTEKQGMFIAKKIKNKIALIYGSQKNEYLCYNLKTRLNETSKNPAFYGVISEICHNEIEIFENKNFLSKIIVILIENASDADFIKTTIKKLKKLFNKNKVSFISIKIKGENELDKTWNALYLADWIGYYLARENKFDPSKTNLIDELKSLI